MPSLTKATLLAASLLLATLFSAAGASAADGYIGLNITTPGEAYADFSNAKRVENSNRPHSFKLYGGFELNDNYAVEMGYGIFGTWKMVNPTAGSKEELRLSSDLLYVAGKATMPLNESFALFGKLGIAHNQFKTEGTNRVSYNASSVRPMVGFGASYKLTEKTSANLEYNYYGSAGNQYTQQKLELGLRYRF